MNLEGITRVLDLVEEFKRRATNALDLSVEPPELPIVGTAATGALRRSSMELTRALADLRRPG